uniref:Uncharacterized protein n=1 Tax=Rhodnius prolixus TaxID=13249 RepID=T1HRL6_RHOPR
MCETKYEYPYIYLLEFHIGDGYFDRQSVGEYSILVTYRDGSNILVKEQERGDDRLVKFRKGKSIIFGINKPSEELKIIFQAIDNHENIGKAFIYFSGVGAPNLLATNSLTSPTASVIRTNLLLSHGVGSLQVFARLTCFGVNLLTDFSVSGKVNTEFDLHVSDIELTAEECISRCNFDVEDRKTNEESETEGKQVAQKDIEYDTLHYLMSDMKLNNESPLGDPSLCFYEASYIAQDESYDLLKDTTDKRNVDFECVKATISELVNEATLIGETNNSYPISDSKPIRNLDDLMFTNFIPPDESTSQEEIISIENDLSTRESGLMLSADASLLDIKVQGSVYSVGDNELKTDVSEEICIEPQIGDAPANVNGAENTDKSEDEVEDDGDLRAEEIPCETGDAPTTSSGTESIADEQVATKLGQKRKKHRVGGKQDQGNEENVDFKVELERVDKVNQPMVENTKRKYAKGKRRGTCNK